AHQAVRRPEERLPPPMYKGSVTGRPSARLTAESKKIIQMKYLALLLAITLSTARAQVRWESDIQKALEKAGASGKLLFVEAYLPTCPACQAMEPNFADQAVAERFNAGFVNYKMDLSVQGARKFLDDRKIELPSFPQFLFFDAESRLVHQ